MRWFCYFIDFQLVFLINCFLCLHLTATCFPVYSFFPISARFVSNLVSQFFGIVTYYFFTPYNNSFHILIYLYIMQQAIAHAYLCTNLKFVKNAFFCASKRRIYLSRRVVFRTPAHVLELRIRDVFW